MDMDLQEFIKPYISSSSSSGNQNSMERAPQLEPQDIQPRQLSDYDGLCFIEEPWHSSPNLDLDNFLNFPSPSSSSQSHPQPSSQVLPVIRSSPEYPNLDFDHFLSPSSSPSHSQPGLSFMEEPWHSSPNLDFNNFLMNPHSPSSSQSHPQPSSQVLPVIPSAPESPNLDFDHFLDFLSPSSSPNLDFNSFLMNSHSPSSSQSHAQPSSQVVPVIRSAPESPNMGFNNFPMNSHFPSSSSQSHPQPSSQVLPVIRPAVEAPQIQSSMHGGSPWAYSNMYPHFNHFQPTNGWNPYLGSNPCWMYPHLNNLNGFQSPSIGIPVAQGFMQGPFMPTMMFPGGTIMQGSSPYTVMGVRNSHTYARGPEKDDDFQWFWNMQIEDIMETTNFKKHPLPHARIKKMMKSEEGVEMISAHVIEWLAKALEMFIAYLTTRAWSNVEKNRRPHLLREDILTAISEDKSLKFLEDVDSN